MGFEKQGEVRKGLTPEAPADRVKQASNDPKAEADRLDQDFTRKLDDQAANRMKPKR